MITEAAPSSSENLRSSLNLQLEERIIDLLGRTAVIKEALHGTESFGFMATVIFIGLAKETYLSHPRVPPEAALIARQEACRYQQMVSDREEVRRHIEQLGVLRFPEQVGLLIGMPGINAFGTAVIMADSITIDRLKTHKQLASHLRAAPRVDASNITVRIGRLNKGGRHMSFQMLLQGVGHLGEGNPFIRGYIRRSTGKPRNKLRATTVACSITQIFYILKKREPNRFMQAGNYLKKMRQVEKIKEFCKAA